MLTIDMRLAVQRTYYDYNVLGVGNLVSRKNLNWSTVTKSSAETGKKGFDTSDFSVSQIDEANTHITNL